MSNVKIRGKVRMVPATPFMPAFSPLRVLWEGPGAPYKSEYAARWAIRKMSGELAQAQAVGIHGRSLIVNLERFSKVAQEVALADFSNRVNQR